MIILVTVTTLLLVGAYAMFGYGGPALSADHNAAVGQLRMDGTICCSVHQEIDGNQYVFMPVLDDEGFFSISSQSVSLRVAGLEPDGTPQEIAKLDAPMESFLPDSVTVVGDRLYIPLVHEDEGRLWTVDISNPESPRDAGLINVDSGAPVYGVASMDDLLLVQTEEEFVFFDVSDPAKPEQVAKYQSPVSRADKFVVDGSRLYYRGRGASRIQVLGISDPSMVEQLGRYRNRRGPTSDVFISRPIADSEEQLQQAAPAGRSLDFAVSEGVLYIAASDAGVDVANVSDPELPDDVGQLTLDGRAVRVTSTDDRLYVLTANEHSREQLAYEVHIFDLSDPLNPKPIDVIDDITAVPGQQAISIGGGYLFLGLNDTLLVLDVSG